MGFNPSPQTIANVKLASQYGVQKSVPASGGARRIFYVNAGIGNNLRVRIEAAQAQGYPANNMTQIEYFEKVTSPEYIAEQQRIADEKEAARLAEVARLELIAKNDNIALNLWTRLESQRIAKEQAEDKRLADVAEAQRLAAIEKERLRIQLLDEQEKERIRKEQEIKDIATAKEFQRVDKSIPLIASVLPITALGILLLYTRGGKK
jgi:hypothetical protein